MENQIYDEILTAYLDNEDDELFAFREINKLMNLKTNYHSKDPLILDIITTNGLILILSLFLNNRKPIIPVGKKLNGNHNNLFKTLLQTDMKYY